MDETFKTISIGGLTVLELDRPAIPPPQQWAAFDFYRRFTAAERIAIRTLAQTDPVAADFMATLDATIASGARVLANDPDLQGGLSYLQAHPAGSPVLTPARALALLAP